MPKVKKKHTGYRKEAHLMGRRLSSHGTLKRKPAKRRRSKAEIARFTKARPKSADIQLAQRHHIPLDHEAIATVVGKARKGEGRVTPAFYSEAMGAWRVEFEIADHEYPGSVWRSSFFCSELRHAQELALEGMKCRTRDQWETVRNRARKLAVERGEFLLYRVMPGRREIFRGHEVTSPGGGPSVQAAEG
jgi:hypothetical protein